MIEVGFGHDIADLVSDVTNITRKSDGNRRIRKEIERKHLAAASPKAKTIKLADMLDNLPSIIEYDPNFALIYVMEKRALLEVLAEGDKSLYIAVKKIIDSFTIS
jgi:(p)ppGpp synthase/HD superfamily hydrolase